MCFQTATQFCFRQNKFALEQLSDTQRIRSAASLQQHRHCCRCCLSPLTCSAAVQPSVRPAATATTASLNVCTLPLQRPVLDTGRPDEKATLSVSKRSSVRRWPEKWKAAATLAVPAAVRDTLNRWVSQAVDVL